MASIPKMLVITPILQISKIPVLICHTIICSLTLLCLCGNVPHKTVGELPAHSHTATISTDGEHTHTAGSLGPIDGHSGNNYAKYHFADGKTGSAGSHAHTLRISDTGNSQSHNIMQPYIAVYCWRRSA
jgi:hypothetical protein|nr:MAG TPA: baseplate protein [Caudoviricetes sp.]